MQEPANVSGQLLGFRTWKEHAVIQCVQEARLADPPSFIDQLSLHDRDLPGRSAEADETKFHPKPECFSEARMFDLGFSYRMRLQGFCFHDLRRFACKASKQAK